MDLASSHLIISYKWTPPLAQHRQVWRSCVVPSGDDLYGASHPHGGIILQQNHVVNHFCIIFILRFGTGFGSQIRALTLRSKMPICKMVKAEFFQYCDR
jgi:hypothetical protein